jgi:hypothetical protein
VESSGPEGATSQKQVTKYNKDMEFVTENTVKREGNKAVANASWTAGQREPSPR